MFYWLPPLSPPLCLSSPSAEMIYDYRKQEIEKQMKRKQKQKMKKPENDYHCLSIRHGFVAVVVLPVVVAAAETINSRTANESS